MEYGVGLKVRPTSCLFCPNKETFIELYFSNYEEVETFACIIMLLKLLVTLNYTVDLRLSGSRNSGQG